LLKTALVFGPAQPSSFNPLAFWNALIASCVSGPYFPSTTILAPLAFNLVWRAFVSSVINAALVWHPTTPSTTNLWLVWKSITAYSVLWPNTPSSTSFATPILLSLSCNLFVGFVLKACLVLSPTIPSTTNKLSVWNCLTATLVYGPKIPSSTSL